MMKGRGPTRSAFTLMEMIVVVVVIAIMASLIMPRLLHNDKRAFKLAVEQTADLLTMYAQRENLGQKPVGLLHDQSRNWLILMSLDAASVHSGDWGEWREDPFVKPVKLPHFMYDTDVEVYADGDRVQDIGDIPLSNEVGKQRPMIAIVMRGAGESATLTLYPYGVAPEVSAGHSVAYTARAQVDLDSTGRSREDW